MNLIYLIRPYEYVISNQNIYKIGYSSKNTFERCANGYGYKSNVFIIQSCKNAKVLESKIIKKFKNYLH